MIIARKSALMVCDFKAIRKDMAGLTQEEMARILGCSRAKVQRVDRGEAYYSPAELVELAKVMGSTVDAILGLESSSPPWLAGYRKLKSKQKKLVDDVVMRLFAFMK
jgi:transcriptional regulator with XRE-family HTH domain